MNFSILFNLIENISHKPFLLNYPRISDSSIASLRKKGENFAFPKKSALFLSSPTCHVNKHLKQIRSVRRATSCQGLLRLQGSVTKSIYAFSVNKASNHLNERREGMVERWPNWLMRYMKFRFGIERLKALRILGSHKQKNLFWPLFCSMS